METFPRHSPVRRPISLPRERTLFFLFTLRHLTPGPRDALHAPSLSDSEERDSRASDTLQQRQIREGRPISENRRDTKSNYVDLRLNHGGPRILSSTVEKFRGGDFRRSLSHVFLGNILRYSLPGSRFFLPRIYLSFHTRACNNKLRNFTKNERPSKFLEN